MRHHGFRDARITRSGPDGGVDIVSASAVAQVKWHVKMVGLGEIQRLYGIAQAENKAGLFFSLGGFSRAAIAWADQHGIAAFTLDPVTPANAGAAKIASLRRGWRRR
jgi:hypothetical protein